MKSVLLEGMIKPRFTAPLGETENDAANRGERQNEVSIIGNEVSIIGITWRHVEQKLHSISTCDLN